jgi:methylation protein EvaC
MNMNKIEFLDLGLQPLANGFMTDKEREETPEFYYELKVGIDANSGLVTLMNYVDAPLMFNDHYAYHGSMSETMKEHFRLFSDRIKEGLKPSKVLEIGSNDGVFIRNFPKEDAIGVEPCGNFAKMTEEMGYKTYPKFWNNELALEIRDANGQMDLIYAANCICHIPDLDETFQAVHSLLSDDGYFIFEDPSLFDMISRTSYDQIYDEHAHVFSCFALSNILQRNGLTVMHVEHLKVHGGSNRIWVKKSGIPSLSVSTAIAQEKLLGLNDLVTFQKFAQEVERSKKELLTMLGRAHDSGLKIAGYGATSKSTTVYNYCGIGPSLIPFVTDTTPSKIGKRTPGTNIPIIAREECKENIDVFYLGAWNFLDEISRKEADFITRGGRFLTHVPKVMLV